MFDKYKFVKHGNEVIAISTYAGKPVRGVATCSPEDEFSIEKGKTLAAARCNAKIAKKRLKRALKQMMEAWDASVIANNRYTDMVNYYADASKRSNEADLELKRVLKDME